jgi:acetyl-CoA carboxylase biotin carboxyl carrier protein
VRFGGRRRSPLAPDPDLVRMLAQLLTEHSLTEIEYSVGERLIRVSRAAAAVSTGAAPSTAGAAAALPDAPGAVTAPMVGTAYLAPQPGASAFVRLGDLVVVGQPLLIIEAMKVMNQIRAPRAGQITRILVEDGQPIEYGTVLMVIE